MTTDDAYDEYSYELTNAMLRKELHVPFCQARVHLLSFFHDYEVISNFNYKNSVRQKFFDELIGIA